MAVALENRLSVPLDVPCCCLKFESNDNMRVKTPLLSFTVLPKAEAWRVEFSFVVSSVNEDDNNDKNGGQQCQRVAWSQGLQLTCL